MEKKILFLAAIIALVLLSGCITPPEPEDYCGNEVCDPNETPQNCPQDCSPPEEKCGDGICDAKERANPDACPKDCEEVIESKIHLLLVVHTGEGNENACRNIGMGDDCYCDMKEVTSLTDLRYVKCRDELKEVAVDLEELEIPALFEFLGPFVEMLSKDPNFSFEEDLINKGHSVGMHGHGDCYYDGEIGEEECEGIDLEAGLYWGSFSGRSNSPTFEQMIGKIDSARLFNPYQEIIGMHGMPYQYEQNGDKLLEEMDRRGIRIWTGTGAIKQDYFGEECSKDNTSLFSHPIIPNDNYGIVYFDHGPSSGETIPGTVNFDLQTVQNRFRKVLECGQEEQSADNPYIFAIGAHLWNLKTNVDGDTDSFDGISDLRDFKTWINQNYENRTVFSKIEDVYDIACTGDCQNNEEPIPYYTMIFHIEPVEVENKGSEEANRQLASNYNSVKLRTGYLEENNYNIKLSLWLGHGLAEYIAESEERMTELGKWIEAGHEIGFHHHDIYKTCMGRKMTQIQWDGYTYASKEEAELIRTKITGVGIENIEPWGYQGDLDDYMEVFHIFEERFGIEINSGVASEQYNKTISMPDEMLYATGSGYLNNGEPGTWEANEIIIGKAINEFASTAKVNGIERKWLSHYSIGSKALKEDAEKTFVTLDPNIVFSTVTHNFNDRELYESYMDFLHSKDPTGAKSVTVKEAIEILPKEEIRLPCEEMGGTVCSGREAFPLDCEGEWLTQSIVEEESYMCCSGYCVGEPVIEVTERGCITE